MTKLKKVNKEWQKNYHQLWKEFKNETIEYCEEILLEFVLQHKIEWETQARVEGQWIGEHSLKNLKQIPQEAYKEMLNWAKKNRQEAENGSVVGYAQLLDKLASLKEE